MTIAQRNQHKKTHPQAFKAYLEIIKRMQHPQGISIDDIQVIYGAGRTSVYDILDDLKSALDSPVQKLANGNFTIEIPPGFFPTPRNPDDSDRSGQFDPEDWLPLLWILSREYPYLPSDIRVKLDALFEKTGFQGPGGEDISSLSRKSLIIFNVNQSGMVEANEDLPFYKNPRIFQDLIQAIDQHEICEIKYQKRKKDVQTSALTIRPYRFFEKKGATYILAKINDYTDFACLRPAGILELARTGQHFEVSNKVQEEVDTFLDSSFGFFYQDKIFPVKVWFCDKWADEIQERNWGMDQNVDLLEDGSIHLAFKARSDVEIVRWVLGYGPDACLLEPPELVKMYNEKINQVAARQQV